MKKHIFLSYRSIEVEFALRLAADLKNAGVNLWMDRLDIKPGDDWMKALGNAVNNCAALISVLTPEYVSSKYCQRELARADRIGRPIFPVILRPVSADDWPMEIELQQYIDFSEWRSETVYQQRLAQLLDALKKRFGEQIAHIPAPETRYLNTLISELETYRGILDYVATQPDSAMNDEARPAPSFLRVWTRFGTFTIQEDTTSHPNPLEGGIDAAAAQHARFVLLGTPGAGKSTVLQYLALEAARARQKNARAPLPLLLKLIQWDQDTPLGDFVRAQWPLDSDVLKLLAKGEIALYLDGLSEIPAAQAKRLRAWLHSDDRPARVVVTCRAADYQGDYVLDLPIISTTDMQEKAIQQFVYEYMGNEEAPLLLQRMTPQLYELAGNPFLLTVLILAHKRSRQQDLPQTAGTLLRLLTMQLWELEHARRPGEIASFAELEAALTDLAFHMTQAEMPTYVNIDYALQYAGSRALLETAANANFLEIEGENVRFFYQPMQQYFAALGLARVGLLPRLQPPRFNSAGLRQPQKWDRTVVLLAGITDNPDVMLDGVADVDPYLALECITEGTRVGDGLRQEVLARVLNGTQHGRVEAARLLARLDLPAAVRLLLETMREGDWEARLQANKLLQGLSLPMLEGVTAILHDLESDIRSAAAMGLRQLDEAALPTLLQLLYHDKWFVRRGAAWGLKEIRDRAAVPALTDALTDKDNLVFAEAALALGWIRDEAAVPALVRALHHKNMRVRRAVAEALGWIGKPAQSGLLGALADPSDDVRRAALEALKGSREPAVIKAILKISYDENVEIRSAALEALKDVEDAIVLKRLIQALFDNARTRSTKQRIADIAAKILEAFGSESAKTALERWRSGELRPETPAPKRTAAQAHKRMKDGSRTQNALAQHMENLRDSDWTVRRKAVQDITHLNPAGALPELVRMLNDEDTQVRVTVIKALATIGSDGALRGLLQALTDQEPLVCDAAAEALKRIGKRAVPGLLETLRSDNPNTRGAVIEILSKVDDGTAVKELMACLDDQRKPWLSELRVCDMAARALENIGTPEAIKAVRTWRETVGAAPLPSLSNGDATEARREIVMELLEALHKTEWTARHDAAKALREYAKVLHDTHEPQIVKRLIEALEDPDWVVRWSVTEALAWIGDKSAVPPLIKQLPDRNWTVQVAVIRALLEIGDKSAASAVLPYLRDKNANVREAAAEALGVLGDNTLVNDLLKALTDPDHLVRLAAIQALGRIGDKRAVPVLLRLLVEAESDRRWFAAQALGQIGDASAVPALIEHLQDSALPQWAEGQRVCDIALLALEAIGTPQAQQAAQQARKVASS
ncbi:MAG: HEAT repeat domain-containing protein [Chloroflexi bacterium]|nr:HEAT repeat domain-containing protein [Chloroflexota bacterium]